VLILLLAHTSINFLQKSFLAQNELSLKYFSDRSFVSNVDFGQELMRKESEILWL